MPMRSRAAALLLVVMCALPATVRAAPGGLAFRTPVKVNAEGWGYEPSIDVDSSGTLYVTAHKGSVTNEGTRLSSFLWSSPDGGASWTELPSPGHLKDGQFSFEGDIAVDRHDRLYFVDTYGVDTWLSRWSADGAWQRSAPAVTGSAFDDRPWLATQGDDVVWLLTTDIATHAVTNGVPETSDGSGWAYSAVLYRSADGGLTWSPGHAFADAQFCGLATSPSEVVVACVTRVGAQQRLVVHRSADAGATWTARDVFTYKGRPDSFVSVAYDKGGTPVTAFADGLPSGHRLYVAYGTAIRDLTPFRGAFQHVWVAADGKGRVGLAFYGTSSPSPTSTSDWYVYGGVAGPSRKWSIARADPRPVLRAVYAPADFLQCVVAPNGRLYVAYSRAAVADALHAPPPDFDHDIYVVSERR